MAKYKVVDVEKLDADLSSVANTIRTKGGTTESLVFPNDFVNALDTIDTSKDEQEKIIDITENGTTVVTPDEGMTLSGVTVNVEVKSGGDTKDNPLQYATFADGSLFKKAQFPENYKIEFGFATVNSSSVQRCFLYSNITEITITTPLGKSVLQFCQGCEKLKVVTFTNGNGILQGNWGSAFYDCKELETINGETDFSNVTNLNNILYRCYKLKDITIKPNSLKSSFSIPSPVLSGESIQSTIDGLNSEVTGQTLTIPRNAAKKAFETSEGANDGDTSETWNALVASKPNWTITLS